VLNAGCAALAAFLGSSTRRRQFAAAASVAGTLSVLLFVYPLVWADPFVELPLVKNAPRPPAGWESAMRGPCARCGEPVWFPEIPGEGDAARFNSFCTACAPGERLRLEEERRLAPRWFWDPRVMTSGVHTYAGHYSRQPDGRILRSNLKDNRLRFYDEGLNTLVHVNSHAKHRENLSLFVNGKCDASNMDDFPTEIMLGGLPLLMHADPQEVMIIGCGSGITAGTATLYREVKRIDLIEIEEAVVGAARLFAASNYAVLPDPARGHGGNPRLSLVIQDARHYCAVTPKRYDVVISEPSNPWMSGPSHLFTQEHFRNIRRVLKEGGLAIQWCNTYSMTPELVYSVIKSFREEFRHALVLCYTTVPGDCFILGSDRPLVFDVDRMRERYARPEVRRDLERIGYTTFTHLFSFLVLQEDDLDRNLGKRPGRGVLAASLGRIPFNTDDFPYVEFEAPASLHRPDTEIEILRMIFGVRDHLFPPFLQDADEALRALNLCPRLTACNRYVGLLDAAMRIAEKGLALNPQDEGVRSELAQLYLRRWLDTRSPDLPGKIRAQHLAWIERNPKSPIPHIQIGELAMTQQTWEEALHHYEKALALGGGGPNAHNALAIAHLKLGHWEEAAKAFEMVLSLDANYTSAYSALADLYEQQGLYDRAMESLMRWIPLEKDSMTRGAILHRYDRLRQKKDTPPAAPGPSGAKTE
jgi:spermidine synthase/tetratricopeptide (TPR) repeat protein